MFEYCAFKRDENMSGGAGFWAVVMVFELWFWFCFNTLVDSHNVFLPPQLVLVLPAWFHLVKFHQSWICQGFISRDIIWCNVIWTSQFLNYVRSAVRRLANNYLSVLNYCKLISIASGYCGCLDPQNSSWGWWTTTCLQHLNLTPP